VVGRVIGAQLFGVSAFDVRTILTASAILAMVGLGAAFLPAWRAASVSPMEALKVD
jgi:ABC-type antimicrobial peptide transport system permease subunit